MLLRAAELGLPSPSSALRAVERAHVGVDLEQRAARRRSSGRRAAIRRRATRCDSAGGDVVAEHEPSRRSAAAVPSGTGSVARTSMRSPAAVSPRARRRAARSDSSGRPRGDLALAPTSTSRTRPSTGAVSDVSIFIASVTATTSPACTSSPAETGMATTTPGAWLRTRPPSSLEIRCGTPSTSTSRSASCSAVMRAVGAAAEASAGARARRALPRGLDARAVDLHAGSGPGRRWQTVQR